MMLKAQISEDMKTAMRAKDSVRLGAIRLLLSAIKQRRDSIASFESANRTDLADIEKFEVTVLQTYMPKQLSDEELNQIITQVIADSGATGAKDMGKVVGLVRPLVAGVADMGKVSGLIKSRLA